MNLTLPIKPNVFRPFLLKKMGDRGSPIFVLDRKSGKIGIYTPKNIGKQKNTFF